MTLKLLPILILLLLASGASATTLHGTLLDADTDTPLSGIQVRVSGGSTFSDSSGRFVIDAPTSGQIDFQSESPCYYTEISYHDLPTGETWRTFRIPSCSSATDPTINPDPLHPDGGHGELKTPGGMTATSTAGRWGGGILSAIAAVGVLAIAVLAGVISAPAFIVIAAVAVTAFIIGFVVLPILTAWGIPGLSWLTGTAQDAGNAITNAFGFHFNTTDPKTVGEGLGDGLGGIVKTIADTFTRVFIDAVKGATGLSESMVWLLTGAIVVLGLLMWYSNRQKLMRYNK